MEIFPSFPYVLFFFTRKAFRTVLKLNEVLNLKPSLDDLVQTYDCYAGVGFYAHERTKRLKRTPDSL